MTKGYILPVWSRILREQRPFFALVLMVSLVPLAWASDAPVDAALADEVGAAGWGESPTSARCDPDPPAEQPAANPPKSVLLKCLLVDQKTIWTAPARVRRKDAKWLAPFALVTGVLIATDRRTSQALPNTKDQLEISRDISRAGARYSTAAIAGGWYLLGRAFRNERAQKTGLLGTEALIDAAAVMGVLKLATRRERPLNGHGDGRFFKGGWGFPSGHALTTWSLATVVARQYRDRMAVRIGATAFAFLLSASRITSREHFASDVVVGGVLGWLVGHYVCRVRHCRAAGRRVPAIAPSSDRRTGATGISVAWVF